MVPDGTLHVHLAFAAMHSTARTCLPPPGASPRATDIDIASSRKQCASCCTVHHPCHVNVLSMRIEVHNGARNSRMCCMRHGSGWHAARGRLKAGGGDGPIFGPGGPVHVPGRGAP